MSSPIYGRAAGFVQLRDQAEFIPSADFMDFIRAEKWESEQISRSLKLGNMPPGLVIDTGNKYGIVVGRYGIPQAFAGLQVIRNGG